MIEPRIRYARTSDGVNIAFAVTGSGPPLLVARPLLRAPVDEDLEFQFDGLSHLAVSRSVVTWDYRGFGLSASMAPEYTLESSLRDMRAIADALSLDRFDILAELSPCHTAIAFAARNPERVRRLVLRNPAQQGGSPRATTLAGLPDIVRTHFREYIQLAMLRMMGWDRASVAKQWEKNLLRQFTPESWLALMDSLEAIDAMPEAPSITASTLVLMDFKALTAINPARQTFIRAVAASIPLSEISVIRPGRTPYYDVVLGFLGAGEETGGQGPGESSGTSIIMFADIVDSTALTERLGDAAFRDRARALDTAMRAIITESGGKTIDAKTLGDGVLATFSSASQAIDAALRCGVAGDAQGLPLHLGLHAGDVIREQDNVFGGAVNIAARISGLSAPGELLVSDTVRSLARTSAGVSFEDRGEHALKGVGDPQRVYAVRRAGDEPKRRVQPSSA